jgi:hypothetical protein
MLCTSAHMCRRSVGQQQESGAPASTHGTKLTWDSLNCIRFFGWVDHVKFNDLTHMGADRVVLDWANKLPAPS